MSIVYVPADKLVFGCIVNGDELPLTWKLEPCVPPIVKVNGEFYSVSDTVTKPAV